MEWSIEHDSVTGEEYIAVDTRGEPLLRDPFTNKSTAFTAAERAELGLDGLVPPAVSTMDQQLARVYENYRVKQTPLERYIHLASLQDRNETLFFRLVHDHIDEMMPIVYTPVVGEACQQFSHIYRHPRGLYISYEQRDRIDAILAEPPAAAGRHRRHRRGTDPRARRSGSRRDGDPDREAVPLHRVRRDPALSDVADHARRRHGQSRSG